MTNPFKKEDVGRFHGPVIEMRKRSRSYVWWIISVIAVVLVLAFLWPR